MEVGSSASLTIFFWFLRPSLLKKKMMPEILNLFGSNELMVSNVAHQIKEKQIIQNIISSFSRKWNFIEIVNRIS